MSRRAIFLDRDGTLIENLDYLSDPAGVRVLPGVPDALVRLREAGYLLVIATNQSGIGRGFLSREEYEAVNRATLAALGVGFDGIYVCPHAPEENCSCRKPAPGLLLRAAAELDVELSGSYMIGDRESDVGAGLNAGCRAILLSSTPPESGTVHAPDLAAAVELIL